MRVELYVYAGSKQDNAFAYELAHDPEKLRTIEIQVADPPELYISACQIVERVSVDEKRVKWVLETPDKGIVYSP